MLQSSISQDSHDTWVRHIFTTRHCSTCNIYRKTHASQYREGVCEGGPQNISSAPHGLSQREQEILRLVAAGYSNQEIAARLVISVGTTKKHLEHIYEKLDAHSRTQAVAGARALGVLS